MEAKWQICELCVLSHAIEADMLTEFKKWDTQFHEFFHFQF